MDSGRTASGGTTATPGIAVYNRATLGGYWQVTDKGTGRSAVLKQTDLGPHPSTGRSIDVTYSAIPQFGYNEGNFPTDSKFSARYIGRDPSRALAHTGVHTSATDAAVGQAQAAPTQPVQPDNSGLILKGLLGGGGRSAYDLGQPQLKGLGIDTGGALRAAGLFNPPAPQVPQAPVQAAPASTGAGPQAASQGAQGAGAQGGGFLPKGALYVSQRTDAGKDLQTNPGGPLIAPGAGRVVSVNSDPRGFGPDYPVVRFTSGPYAGQDVYLGHSHAALKAGESFTMGQTLAHTGTSGVGNATVPGWAEIGFASALGQGDKGQGAAIARHFK